MDMAQAEQIFIDEALDLLHVMDACLMEFEAGDATAQQHIAAIFRAAHTIKGSAGLFGFDHIVGFTHSVESVLDKVRDQKLALDPPLLSLLLDCQHQTLHMVQALHDPTVGYDEHRGAALLT